MSGLIGNRLEDILETVLVQYSGRIDETLTATLLDVLDGTGAAELILIIEGIKGSCDVNDDE